MATQKAPRRESTHDDIMQGELEILRAAARGSSLLELSEMICRALEEAFEGARASILGLDRGSHTLSFVAGPSLPDSYTSMIKGSSVGPHLGSCSQSAFAGAPVVTPDISKDPGWSSFLDVAEKHGFSSAWSWPLLSGDGEVLGTIGLYFGDQREADADDRARMTRWSTLTSEIIGERASNYATDAWRAHILEMVSSDRSVLFDCNEDGKICDVIAPGEPFGLLDQDTLIGTPFSELLEPMSEAAWTQALSDVESEGGIQKIEPLFGTVGSRQFAWNCTLTRAPSRIGSEAVWLVLLDDVTELHYLRRRQAHERRMRSVGKIGAGVAHEINNPLAYVEGNASFLQRALGEDEWELDRDEMLAALDDLQDGVARIKRIVKDLTAYAGADDDQMGAVNIAQAVNSALNLLTVEIGNGFDVELDVDDDVFVWGNETRFAQVLINLMRNAVQAMREEHTSQPRLTIAASRRSDRVSLEVSDNGPGVPDDIVDQIFDPFFSSRASRTGTGLGLNIVHDIVDEMGGDIEVETSDGGGARFAMAFDAAEPALEDDAVVEKTDTTDLEILVVDDDPLVARALGRMLEPDHTLTHAASARKALEMLERQQFDVLLVDLMMPEIDGVRFLQRLRMTHPEQARHTAFITAGITDEFIRDFVDNSDVPIRFKPIDRPDLDELLDELKNRH